MNTTPITSDTNNVILGTSPLREIIQPYGHPLIIVLIEALQDPLLIQLYNLVLCFTQVMAVGLNLVLTPITETLLLYLLKL